MLAGKGSGSPSPQASPPQRSRKGHQSCLCSSPDLWFYRACRCAGCLWKCLRLAVFDVWSGRLFWVECHIYKSELHLWGNYHRSSSSEFITLFLTSSLVWSGSRVSTRIPGKHSDDWGESQTQTVLSLLGAPREVAEGSIWSIGSSGLIG